jgi:hypothetical protein
MTTTTESKLYLSLPKLRGRLYWELEVSNTHIWVSLKKRPWGLWRNAISPIARDLISHRGRLTQDVLDTITEVAGNMIAGTTPADVVFVQLSAVTDDSVKVVLDR